MTAARGATETPAVRYASLRSYGQGYDVLGDGYASARRTEPSWERRIAALLEGAHWVCNVGAGAGSYETAHTRVVAVEPSSVMRLQRPSTAGPCLAGRAEDLPFDDDAFDVSMALLTIHHWADLERGLRELQRVAKRYVVLTYDMSVQQTFWLTAEYIPEIAEAEHLRVPSIDRVLQLLGPSHVESLLVPADCRDGFVTAFWRRPWALLEPSIRRSCSALALTAPEAVDRGLTRLRDDLASGAWHREHEDLLDLPAWDAGFRLIHGPA